MIRKATLEDIPRIVQIHRLCDKWLGAPHIGAYKQKVGEIHVAETSDKTVVGFVHYHRRKDGVSTIYTIAVHPDYSRNGYGRHLLWSVPTPIRLKVTADNEKAIIFYELMHMRHTKDEISRTGRPLKVYELKRLFVQVAGNNRHHARIAKEVGIPYGIRSDHYAYGYPFMMDINWKNYVWTDYLQAVNYYRPVMAMVPDYTDRKQRRELYRQIRELKYMGVLNIMVCPKFDGAVKDIPSFCTIAVSIPSRYAGFLPNPKELVGRRLHLLGGTPKTQLKYIKENTELNIVSSDMNVHLVQPSFAWDKKWYRTGLHYLETYKISSFNIANALQE